MIERLMLRASDPAANGGDPLAALNPELIIGPMVRTFGTLGLATKDATLNIIANPLQLLGLALNIWLYGMQLMQVEVYFRSNPRYVSHLFYSLLRRYRPDYQASDSYTFPNLRFLYLPRGPMPPQSSPGGFVLCAAALARFKS